MIIFRNLCRNVLFNNDSFLNIVKKIVIKEINLERNNDNESIGKKDYPDLNLINNLINKTKEDENKNDLVRGDLIDLDNLYTDNNLYDMLKPLLINLKTNILYVHNINFSKLEVEYFFDIKKKPINSFRIEEKDVDNFIKKFKVKKPLKDTEYYNFSFIKKNFINIILDPVFIPLTEGRIFEGNISKVKEVLYRLASICKLIEKNQNIVNRIFEIKKKFNILFLLDEIDCKIPGKEINDLIELTFYNFK